MGRLTLTVLAVVLSASAEARGGESYELAFSTFLGGSDWEHARDVAVDGQGNVYVVGGTASSDFPTTAGAYSRRLSTGGSQEFGPCDVFVAKFGAAGNLIWSTYIGGPDYDRAYGVEVDGGGYVYVAGRAGPGFPVKNAFQPEFNGVDNGSYGMQNAFVLKLLPDGSDLAWSSYVGVSTLCRDIAIDDKGDVYVPGGRWNTGKVPPVEWFANAYQKTPPGGKSDCGVIKIKSDGSQVLWATWLGGSAEDGSAASIRVGKNGRVYIGGSTFSDDFPTTPGAFDRSYGGQADFFVASFTPDGNDLVYGTYLGGANNEWISTHNLAIDDSGNAYVATPTGSAEYPTTAGAYQRAFAGGGTDWAITKLSATGALLASTFVGGSGSENPDGIYVDASGNVFVTGETRSSDFPLTANSYQSGARGGTEAVLLRLSADFNDILYCTYMGGGSNDNGRSGCLGGDGSLYMTGSTDGAGWPVKNAFQSTFAGGGGSWGNGDCILARFAPVTTIRLDSAVTYQTMTGWEATAWVAEPKDAAFPNYRDTVFDMAVNDVGINRVRLEIRSGVENSNDNWSD
ncbi:MAG: SBBP repeat-containing protein, partial [Phycisphaerales bacterium]